MLNDYMVEFHTLRAELQRLLDNAEADGSLRASVETKMREIKGKSIQCCRQILKIVAISPFPCCTNCIGALEMELRSMSPAQRNSYLNEVQKCRGEFSTLQRRYLLLTSRGRDTSASAQRTRCGQALEKLNSANMQLEGSKKLAEETEEVGANILCNLYMQRESIQRANRHAEETNASLRESNSLVTKMGKWWSGLIG
ncbi:hypothetical protein Esti_003924 [Eimeria stiedai]